MEKLNQKQEKQNKRYIIGPRKQSKKMVFIAQLGGDEKELRQS